jgi:hypothetical protein
MKLLSENILTDSGDFNGCRSYSEYIGYFEHTRESGEVMLIKICFHNDRTDKGLSVNLFIKEQGFTMIADFDCIPLLVPISRHNYRSDAFVERIQYNNGVIGDWLDIVFH